MLLLLIVSGAAGLHAQSHYHQDRAIDFMLNGLVDSAHVETDLQMKEPGADKDPDVLQWRGIIYYELYKRYEGTNFTSPYRNIALQCFANSLALDTVSARVQLSRDYCKSIASRFYNDAVSTLDTVNFATSAACYQSYRKAVLLSDPKFDINKKDVEFYLALASTYLTKYNADKKANAQYFDSTRNTYMHVLAIDPNNYSANYNLGVIFWNKGVDLMYDIDYDDSLGMVFDVQDRSVELFKQSLPFAEKAYEMEPKREETLIVLSGIYYSLNEFEKSDKYKEMLDNLRNNPNNTPNNNPNNNQDPHR
jgi:hypothetical protein